MNRNLPVPQSSLSTYLVEISRFPLLSKEEEFELASRYQKTGDVEAAHKLVTSNLRFVVKIAYEYASYGIRMGDLIQEGNIGLMKAVKKFDPAKGYRLISYAVWWIRATIRNFILQTWSLVKIGTTQAQRKLFYKMDKAKKAFLRDFSLDTPLSDDSQTTYLDQVPSADNQEESLARAEERTVLQDKVQQAVAQLNDRERFIVEKRLMNDDPLTLQEIGNFYQISRERARQLEEKVKGKLKKILIESSPQIA
ncbi:MAG: sigma-70 family RNA polymerase sigma factor [Deltaproteobacteria bacterium]|nr:sigma-70 family RNA polymerase sigma factor [Deltaproteobacteria bacterium]